MSTGLKWSFLLVVVSLMLVRCQGHGPKSGSKDKASFPGQMQKMSRAINDLIPYTYSYKAFNSAENKVTIKKKISAFKKAIHKVPLKSAEKMVGKDPLIQFSLEQLRDDVERAEKSFEMGHNEYSRSLLQGSVGHCFRCHSRNQFGPEYFMSPSSFGKVTLSLTEKADLYVATRQYEKALEVLKTKLNDPVNFYDEPYELEKALKKYLAIVVRIKKKPQQGIDTIEKFLERKNIPYYLAEDSRRWADSLNAWLAEGQRPGSLKLARKLMARGENLQSAFGLQKGYIEYLRASAILHDLLRSPKAKGRVRSVIYFELGKSYEVISELGFWSLPEVYYEACVRNLPKSKVAKSCFRNFERNIVLGFTGSSGMFVPEDERLRLDELRGLAGL